MSTRRVKTIQAVTGIAGLLAAGLVMVPGSASAVQAVAPAKAGSIEVWGDNGASTSPKRASYAAADGPWSAVALAPTPQNFDFAITSDSTLRKLGSDTTTLEIPSELRTAKVTAVSTYSQVAAAVTKDGGVRVWGSRGSLTPQVKTPTDLGGNAVDVAVGSTMILVLLDNGKVGVISGFPYEHVKGADGQVITKAAEIAIYTSTGFARLSGGGVVGFTSSGVIPGYPVAVTGDTLADPVVSFDAKIAGVVAVTQSGTVHTWDPGTGAPLETNRVFPTSSVTGKVVDVAAAGGYFAARTSLNEVKVWGKDSTNDDYSVRTTVPTEVAGQRISDLVGGPGNAFAAIMAAPLVDLSEDAKPSIAGTAQVGKTLTGTPATFKGQPDTVTNKWYAGDTEVGSGATYQLTAAETGKNITFKSTATRTEDSASLESTPSNPVGPVIEAPIASTTVVAAPTNAYGTAGTATVTVGNAGGKAVSGTVTLTGAGAAQTAALVGGTATFALAPNLAPTAYTLTATYSGNTALNASSGAVGYTVAKAKARAIAFKASKKPTSKKSGKATVTVTAPSGLAKASGKVTVTIKGKSKKTIRATLSGGKRSITVPKLKKGTYTVTVTYAGDTNYGPAKSKSYTLKIKK